MKRGPVGLLLAIFIVAAAAPLLANHDPDRIKMAARLQGPSTEYWLGTDHFGRDVYSRIIYGARLAVVTGLMVAGIAAVVGILIGSTAAYFRVWGTVVMRVVDGVMAFPAIILALGITAIAGHASLTNVITALTIVYTPRVVRLAYGLGLSLRDCAYVEAARAIGMGNVRILLCHIIPSMVSPVVVQSTFTCALAILGAASLDFLGVGVPPYVASWGIMIQEAKIYMTSAPWIAAFPGLCMVIFVLALNLCGDTLRDMLDPHLRKSM